MRQGSPNYPTPEQYKAIKAREGLELCEAPLKLKLYEGRISHCFQLPTHGVSLLLIKRA